jgi:hypothetical protein
VPPNDTDLSHYWALECRYARGEEPHRVLALVEKLLAEKPETKGELQSLEAVILAKLGETRRAAEVARSAVETVRAALPTSIIARGHWSIVRERAAHLVG